MTLSQCKEIVLERFPEAYAIELFGGWRIYSTNTKLKAERIMLSDDRATEEEAWLSAMKYVETLTQ